MGKAVAYSPARLCPGRYFVSPSQKSQRAALLALWRCGWADCVLFFSKAHSLRPRPPRIHPRAGLFFAAALQGQGGRGAKPETRSSRLLAVAMTYSAAAPS